MLVNIKVQQLRETHLRERGEKYSISHPGSLGDQHRQDTRPVNINKCHVPTFRMTCIRRVFELMISGWVGSFLIL